MIVSEVFYGIKCNRCDYLYEGNEFSFWADEGMAEDEVLESEWYVNGNKHYCPDCYEINEEDDVVIYEAYPKHLKKLIIFLTEVVRLFSKSVKESDSEFEITFRCISSKDLEPSQEQYIRSFLGDKFLSLKQLGAGRYYVKLLK